jgi:hypothetical protein
MRGKGEVVFGPLNLDDYCGSVEVIELNEVSALIKYDHSRHINDIPGIEWHALAGNIPKG